MNLSINDMLRKTKQLEHKLKINLSIYKVFMLGLLYLSRLNKYSKLLNNIYKPV